jgi:hypothetical protein
VYRKPSNDHYVSQVLLDRFRPHNAPLYRYRIDRQEWRPKNKERVCSARGWNQLIAFGEFDDSLEAEFAKVENRIPETFAALDDAATRPSTELPAIAYDTMCQYCAFLRLVSPFAKAAAAVTFLHEVNSQLQTGECDLLRELTFPEETIESFRKAYALGGRIILYSEDSLQLVYRMHFRRLYPFDFSVFRHSVRWTVCNSPIDLPISDIAFFDLPSTSENSVIYILPLSPRLLLKGIIPIGTQSNSSATIVKADTLTFEEAEYWLHVICLSALRELISRRKIPEIEAIRTRAERNGISFAKIENPDRLMRAGLIDFNTPFGLRIVSEAEYVRFVHSFLRPPSFTVSS